MEESRRQRTEVRFLQRSSASITGRQSLPDGDPHAELHAEIQRLPEKYRVPIVLCYFEGLTHEQATG